MSGGHATPTQRKPCNQWVTAQEAAAHDAAFDDAHAPLVAVACWALGEYGDDVYQNRLPDEPPLALTQSDVVDTLKSVLRDARAPRDTARRRSCGSKHGPLRTMRCTRAHSWKRTLHL